MIPIKRSEIVQKLSEQEVKNFSGHNHLVRDIIEGAGDQTMAYLIKKGEITFTNEQLKDELNLMVESSLMTIHQWEKMVELLENAGNGNERITAFLKKKRRFKII